MKINNINNNVSFGLKIKDDKEYREFIKYLQTCNNFSQDEINVLTKSINDLSFNNDCKNSTTIAFGPIKNIQTGTTHIIDEGIFFDTYEGSYNHYKDGIPYQFFDTKDKIPTVVDMRCYLLLENASLKDILREIASDYAKYAYSKEL